MKRQKEFLQKIRANLERRSKESKDKLLSSSKEEEFLKSE